MRSFFSRASLPPSVYADLTGLSRELIVGSQGEHMLFPIISAGKKPAARSSVEGSTGYKWSQDRVSERLSRG